MIAPSRGYWHLATGIMAWCCARNSNPYSPSIPKSSTTTTLIGCLKVPTCKFIVPIPIADKDVPPAAISWYPVARFYFSVLFDKTHISADTNVWLAPESTNNTAATLSSSRSTVALWYFLFSEPSSEQLATT